MADANDTINLTEFGAAEQVPGSKLLLNLGTRGQILIDVGNEYTEQRSSNPDTAGRDITFPAGLIPKDIRKLVLTHGHADHIGQLLAFQDKGFSGDIYSTRATVDITELQTRQEIEMPRRHNDMIKGKRFQYGPRKGQLIPFVEEKYNDGDLEDVMKRFVKDNGTKGFTYGSPIKIADGVTATFYEAGHIPGSAQVLFEIQRDGKTTKLLTAFDLGRTDYQILNHPVADTPIVKFPHTDFPKDIDYIVVEATYGNKTHAPLEESLKTLEQAASDVVKNRGVLVIPAFSIMRTHMLWNFLYNLNKEGRLPQGMTFYTSSPMAEEVGRIILKHSDDFDENAKRDFANQNYNPFKFGSLVHHERGYMTEDLFKNRNGQPFAVIASSGMCEGGRIEMALRYTISDPKNIVLLTGYGAHGTRADLLMRKEKMIPFNESMIPLYADVRKMGGLSGHADITEIITHLKNINPNFKGIFIKHGDKDACYAARDAIIAAGYAPDTVHVLKKGEAVTL
jgi:metallo-beta-lactamase family protein